MWALLNSDNTLNKILTRPKALTIGDVNYPANIFSMWTLAEREALGIADILQDNTNIKDENYYINTVVTSTVQTDVTINGIAYTKVATSSYGTATAKALADTLYTAQDEIDGEGTEGEVKSQGLKSRHKEKINNQAGHLLRDTEWMVIRATEGGTAVPSATTTWRAAVRTKANSMQAQIDGAANVDALAALYVYNSDSPKTRPLGDFPKLGA